MADTTGRWLSWSNLQGIVVLAAIFMVGTPAGFSIYGLSWKFPWLADPSAEPRDGQLTQIIANKPALSDSLLTVERVWTSQSSVIFCVTVRNDQNRSLQLRLGHVNLSELGVAKSDWPAATLPSWEMARFQVAKVQIVADREVPGTPHVFNLDLTVPPGHARKFLLQMDVANLPMPDRNRFYAVGSLVLEDGAAELTTPEFNFFGRRLQAEAEQAMKPLAVR